MVSVWFLGGSSHGGCKSPTCLLLPNDPLMDTSCFFTKMHLCITYWPLSFVKPLSFVRFLMVEVYLKNRNAICCILVSAIKPMFSMTSHLLLICLLMSHWMILIRKTASTMTVLRYVHFLSTLSTIWELCILHQFISYHHKATTPIDWLKAHHLSLQLQQLFFCCICCNSQWKGKWCLCCVLWSYQWQGPFPSVSKGLSYWQKQFKVVGFGLVSVWFLGGSSHGGCKSPTCLLLPNDPLMDTSCFFAKMPLCVIYWPLSFVKPLSFVRFWWLKYI